MPYPIPWPVRRDYELGRLEVGPCYVDAHEGAKEVTRLIADMTAFCLAASKIKDHELYYDAVDLVHRIKGVP